MRQKRLLAALLVLAGLLLCAFTFQSAKQDPSSIPKRQPRITVGPNVLVSQVNSGRAHWETRIDADPVNPNRLLACSIIHSGGQNAVHDIAYLSEDGGKTWKPTLESDGDLISDPDCVFGINGAAYFSTTGSPKPGATRISVYRSLDGGAHWDQPTSLPFLDREYLTIDRTTGSRRGLIYLHGVRTNAPTVDGNKRQVLSVLVSSDNGTSFKPVANLWPDGDHRAFGSGNAEVLSDGTYIMAFPEWATRHPEQWIRAGPGPRPREASGAIKVVRSEDGGDSFEKANVVAPWYACQFVGLPMIAADHSAGPFRNRIYIAWADNQSGRCDIRFSYSADKGKTWSPSRLINDEPEQAYPRERRSEHLLPVLAVNNQGVVGIAWYDRRDNPDALGWYVRFAASFDGGETFLSSVRVSSAPQAFRRDTALPIWVYNLGGGSNGRRRPLSINVGRTATGEGNGGDTFGMVADANGLFHPLWVDNRTGILQLWTTIVSVKGVSVENGADELAKLDDITADVALRYSNTSCDPEKGTVSFDAVMVNTSRSLLHAPFKVRVLALRAATGSTAEIVNSDNEENGPGSIWDFTPLVDGGVLKPGDQSRSKRLDFHIAHFDRFRRTSDGNVDGVLIRVDCAVLGKKVGPN